MSGKGNLGPAKPRGDSKLETLPANRQDSIYEHLLGHTLNETLAWLRQDGVDTSRSALSRFHVSYELRQRFRQDEATTDAVLEEIRRTVQSVPDEELERLGQKTFSLLALRQQNATSWLRVRGAKFKAELEKAKLELRRAAEERQGSKLAFEREKWVQESCGKILAAAGDARTREIAELAVPNEEKIKLLRKHWFADVDELEKSGAVRLPAAGKRA